MVTHLLSPPPLGAAHDVLCKGALRATPLWALRRDSVAVRRTMPYWLSLCNQALSRGDAHHSPGGPPPWPSETSTASPSSRSWPSPGGCHERVGCLHYPPLSLPLRWANGHSDPWSMSGTGRLEGSAFHSTLSLPLTPCLQLPSSSAQSVLLDQSQEITPTPLVQQLPRSSPCGQIGPQSSLGACCPLSLLPLWPFLALPPHLSPNS